jgi:hypothetical protein
MLEWRRYHKFATLTHYKHSFFYIRKRAYKIFNSESKQDRYSSKNLIRKCFNFKGISESKSHIDNFKFNYFTHLSFWIDYSGFESNSFKDSSCLGGYFCIHCGIKMIGN